MGTQVTWEWDSRAGVYDLAGEGDGIEVRVRTANLGYASELTRLLLQSKPAAYVPEVPAPTEEEIAARAPHALVDSDDNQGALKHGEAT